MKIVVLLALVGLASCHIPFIGGDRARNVEIEYSFKDEYGRDVEVEVKTDSLAENSKSSVTKFFTQAAKGTAPIPVAAPVTQYVNRFNLHRPEDRTQFVGLETPRPFFTQIVQRAPVAVSRPMQTTRLVQVAAPVAARVPVAAPVAAPVPVVTQYITTEHRAPVAVSRPMQGTRLVQVAAPVAAPVPVVTQYITREHRPEPNTVYVRSEGFSGVVSQPAITQFVEVEPVAAPLRQRVVTQYVQAEPAPVARPVISRTRFVKADLDVPVAFQPAHQVIPVAAPVRVVHSPSHFQSSLIPVSSQTFRESDDDSSEK